MEGGQKKLSINQGKAVLLIAFFIVASGKNQYIDKSEKCHFQILYSKCWKKG
jgi:hypothetical protein